MLARLLDAKLRAGDPDAKFLLIAFWKHYGSVTPKPRSQKQLAEDLRLPVQAVSKAVAQLVDVGVLRVVTQPEPCMLAKVDDLAVVLRVKAAQC